MYIFFSFQKFMFVYMWELQQKFILSANNKRYKLLIRAQTKGEKKYFWNLMITKNL